MADDAAALDETDLKSLRRGLDRQAQHGRRVSDAHLQTGREGGRGVGGGPSHTSVPDCRELAHPLSAELADATARTSVPDVAQWLRDSSSQWGVASSPDDDYTSDEPAAGAGGWEDSLGLEGDGTPHLAARLRAVRVAIALAVFTGGGGGPHSAAPSATAGELAAYVENFLTPGLSLSPPTTSVPGIAVDGANALGTVGGQSGSVSSSSSGGGDGDNVYGSGGTNIAFWSPEYGLLEVDSASSRGVTAFGGDAGVAGSNITVQHSPAAFPTTTSKQSLTSELASYSALPLPPPPISVPFHLSLLAQCVAALRTVCYNNGTSLAHGAPYFFSSSAPPSSTGASIATEPLTGARATYAALSAAMEPLSAALDRLLAASLSALQCPSPLRASPLYTRTVQAVQRTAAMQVLAATVGHLASGHQLSPRGVAAGDNASYGVRADPFCDGGLSSSSFAGLLIDAVLGQEFSRPAGATDPAVPLRLQRHKREIQQQQQHVGVDGEGTRSLSDVTTGSDVVTTPGLPISWQSLRSLHDHAKWVALAQLACIAEGEGEEAPSTSSSRRPPPSSWPIIAARLATVVSDSFDSASAASMPHVLEVLAVVLRGLPARCEVTSVAQVTSSNTPGINGGSSSSSSSLDDMLTNLTRVVLRDREVGRATISAYSASVIQPALFLRPSLHLLPTAAVTSLPSGVTSSGVGAYGGVTVSAAGRDGGTGSLEDAAPLRRHIE